MRVTVLLALLALAFAAPASAAAADPAAPLYDPAAVSLADIVLPQSSIDALNADPYEYQPGTLVMTVAGVSHGPLQVGVRLKGHGSFQPLSGKASFKLKLNWVSGQKLLGLKKMTLNNMAQDPSRIRELLAYTLHRAAGVPASRSGFTFVTLNGEDYGLYSNIETYDDVSLGKLLGETQHLYEGSYDAGFGADLLPGHETAFEVDEGDETDRSDLTALIAAAGRSDGAFSDNVAAFADLAEMTRMWAVENYAGHWDSYSVAAGNPLLPNNYYLHDGPDGVFRMLPSGTDTGVRLAHADRSRRRDPDLAMPRRARLQGAVRRADRGRARPGGEPRLGRDDRPGRHGDRSVSRARRAFRDHAGDGRRGGAGRARVPGGASRRRRRLPDASWPCARGRPIAGEPAQRCRCR